MNTKTNNIVADVPANLRWLLNNFRAKHRGLEHCLDLEDDDIDSYTFTNWLASLLKSDNLPVPIDWIWDIKFAFNPDSVDMENLIQAPHQSLGLEVPQLSRLLYRSSRFGRLLELSPISPLGISKETYLSLLFPDVATFVISPQNPALGYKWKREDYKDWPHQATQIWPVPLLEVASVVSDNGHREVNFNDRQCTEWRHAVKTLRASTHIEALTSYAERHRDSIASVVAVGDDDVEVIFVVKTYTEEAWNDACDDIQQEFEAAHAPISAFDHQALATVPWTKDECDLIFLNDTSYADEEDGNDDDDDDDDGEEEGPESHTTE